ncbi:recombinase family protein [Lysinibacillus sp. FSL K6-0102]|uniref:recombinase family protein n=1 Tax=Lysinibacillus sp. FSL K6-0102 TaxID=2975290 RepID=UPI0028E27951|nr:recombinase family protein [uncultured Lysinibacillus sp.]
MTIKKTAPKGSLRAAIYIRVSIKNLQEDRYSLSAQTTELTRYAESQGWEIVDIFKDTDSGTKLKKPGLESLLDYVEDGKIDVVLVIEQDRLSRLDAVSWHFLKNVLRENNVKIAEPGHIMDLSNVDDEFYSDLKNIFAHRNRRDIIRKMMRGKRQFTREGKVWGKQPDGYIHVKETSSVVVDENRSWIIPYIDDLLLEQGISATGVASCLNQLCKTPTGKEWTVNQVIQRYKNKAYHGVLEKTFSNGETITVEDVYPKLRSLETFEAITQRLKENYKAKPAEPHFLRNVIITCASCNRLVSVYKTSSHSKKKDKTYPVFTVRHLNESTHNDCEAKPYVNTKRIKNSLITAVKSILIDEKTAKKYIDAEFDDKELDKIKKQLSELNKQKNDVNSKMDKILKLYLDGKWSEEVLDKERDQLDSRLKHIENSIDDLKRKYELVKTSQFNYDVVVEFLSIAAHFDSLLEESEQQRLIGFIFPTATLDVSNNLLIMHARLPQQVTLDIRIDIETMEAVKEREMYAAAREKYNAIQTYLNKNKGVSLERIQKHFHSNYSTLIKYQEWFGPFKHLAPNRLGPEMRQKRIKTIKKALQSNPNATGRQLEKITGINRKMIYKLIREEKLR